MNLIERITDPALLYIVPAALLTIVFHEVSHGFAAYRLGDQTAKSMGRLSLNPLRHIDIIGLLMLVFAGFGWAKPVPVDMRYFKNPKRDMAIVAFAGPCANFLLALVSLIVLNIVALFLTPTSATILFVIYNFFLYLTYISIGLGVFNLFPVLPLDGFKLFGALLPDRWYYSLLRYERYGMIVLVVLLYSGIISGPLATLRGWVFDGLNYLAVWPAALVRLLMGGA